MTQADHSNDLESRFAHLLKPIRDLTKNWDVDIASHLEDYLEEIESISITFDGGATKMNFAEAALLIQGTACVYSKKVEYLYALVYQVLDLLSSKKKLQQASSVDENGDDNDATLPGRKNEDEEFLTLDDIKEHKNIDLKHGEDENETLSFVHTIPRTPTALVPMEDTDKGENPLLSRAGEILGSRNDFKMNTCTIHASATMLLDMSHLSLLENSIRNHPSSTPHPTLVITEPAGEEPNAKPEEANDVQVDEGLQDMSMDDNEGGFDASDAPQDMAEDVETKDKCQAGEDGVRQSERIKEKVAKAPLKPVIDPWIPMDPHQADVMLEKPFKKGRTCRIPTSLESETKKRKRKKALPEKQQKLIPIAEFCAKAYHSHASKFPSNPLKVPDFPEFEHLFWIEFKRRQALQRKERKELAEQGRFQELAEEEQEVEQENDNYVAANGGDEDDNVDFGVPDSDEGDYPNIDEIQERVGPMALEFNSQEEGVVVNSYEDLVRHHVEGFLASAQQYAQITELSRRVSEWEEKILPKLKEEEEHDPFDIHKYGSSILEELPEKNEIIPFRNIVMNKQHYQICRLFLASLQLANNYNIHICSEGVLEKGMDTMGVKLLSKKRHFEELAEYQAPSLTK